MKLKRFSAPFLVALGVLACVAIPALAVTPKVGKWTGVTKFTFSLFGTTHHVEYDTRFSTVRARGGGRRVERFSLLRYKLIDCTPSGAGPYGSHGFESHLKPKVRNGKFKFTEKQGSKTLTVRGRFTGTTRARGTLTATFEKPGVKCTTGGKLHWTAESGSGHAPTHTK
jgi:hypothetical protein